MILAYLYGLLGLLILLAIVAFFISGCSRGLLEVVSAFVAGGSLFAGLLLTIILTIFTVEYFEASVKAELLNREYGTSYTLYEVMLAEDVIDTVRELKRQRIEVNGNLLREGE